MPRIYGTAGGCCDTSSGYASLDGRYNCWKRPEATLGGRWEGRVEVSWQCRGMEAGSDGQLWDTEIISLGVAAVK